jgi:hypothetical protein
LTTEEEIIVAPLKITVFYGRKISTAPYENEEASIHVQADVPVNGFQPEIDEAIQTAYITAKTHVLSQLGIEYSVNEYGIIRELERVLQATVVASAPNPPRTSMAPAAAANGDRDVLWADLQAEYVDDGASFVGHTKSFWDNREDKRNPKAPDWKNKKTGDGLWINKAPAWFGPSAPAFVDR